MVKNLTVFSSEKKYKINKFSIHKLISELKKELNFKVLSLTINFISSEKIISINKEYLNHNYSTDIITFNYSGDNRNLDGEIFISCQDAQFNAKTFNNNLREEFKRLVIHGILHLLGYEDVKEKDKKVMKRLENDLVNRY
ncbi:MAG TPA: rRNA maturation RNase YbeY [Ignavibacteriaceae bacterium]|nr:rRNA maturation RNase YbeY [Ignavibacteriaceae bacterium]